MKIQVQPTTVYHVQDWSLVTFVTPDGIIAVAAYKDEIYQRPDMFKDEYDALYDLLQDAMDQRMINRITVERFGEIHTFDVMSEFKFGMWKSSGLEVENFTKYGSFTSPDRAKSIIGVVEGLLQCQ